MTTNTFIESNRGRRLSFIPFLVPEYNAHYEGAYDERTLLWRRLGASDKASNIAVSLEGRNVQRVLEVGCGTGAVIAQVAQLSIGKEHVGVDLANPGVHRDSAAANIELRQFDGNHLPFEDAEFDLVFASHVVEHVPEPRSFLAEISRVTKKWIYLEVPCELHIRTNVVALQRSLNIGHINAYTPESFRLLVESTGLKVVRQDVFDHSLAVHSFGTSAALGYIKFMLRRGLLMTSPLLASRVFTYHSGILAEKRA